MAEFRIFQPGMYQVSSAVNLVKIFYMMCSVPFVSEIMETMLFCELIIFETVPLCEIGNINRIQLVQLFLLWCLCEKKVLCCDSSII